MERTDTTTDRAPSTPLLGPIPIPNWVLLLGGIGGSLFGLYVGKIAKAGSFPSTAAPLAAAAVGAVFLVGLGARFWPALVGIYLLRPALDAFKTTTGSSGLDPGTAIGAVFIVAAVLWLAAQRRGGTLFPASRAAKAFVLLAGAAVLSAPGSLRPFFSLASSVKLVSVALMFLVLEQVYRRDPGRIRVLVLAVFLSTLIPTMATIGQGIWGLPPESPWSTFGRSRGSFTHPNPYATYLVGIALLGIALAPHLLRQARAAKRYGLLVGVGLLEAGVLYSLVLTYSRGAWLSLVTGIVVIGILQNRWILGVLLVGLVVLLIAVPSVLGRFADLANKQTANTHADPNSLSWRIKYWGEILPYAKSSPITGIGSEMTRNTHPTGFDPHNGFVQSLVEMGVLGLLALLSLITTMALDLRKALKRNRAPGFERGVCVAACAMALAMLQQLPSENLLVSAVNWWYLLVPVAWAIVSPGSTVPTTAEPAHEQAVAADGNVDADDLVAAGA